MLAKATGICIFCNGSINVGDDIQWGKKGARKGMEWHVACKISTVTDEETEETEETPPVHVNGNVNGHHNASANDPLGAMMATAVLPFLKDALQSSGKVDANEVIDICQQQIKLATLPRGLQVTIGDKVFAKIDSTHRQVEEIIPLVANDFHVYLYGAAGGGKTTAMMHVAKALDMEFMMYSCSPFSTPIELKGYMSGHGEYTAGLLKLAKNRATETGKNILFLIDEADRARPDFLPCLNSFLAQGSITLPNGEELKNGNVVIALAGNTPGRGANSQYNSASKMDASVLDRFGIVEWEYDTEIERMAAQNNAWVDYVHQVREYVGRADTKADLVVSPRASIDGAKALRCNIPLAKVIKWFVFRGIAADTAQRILTACPIPHIGNVRGEN